MKTILIISLLLIVLVSCNKDKSDARKMVGTWKRSVYNPMSNSILRVDTVHFTKNQFTEKDFLTQNNITSSYYLSNSNIYFISGIDTFFYSYNFTDKNSFTLLGGYLQDNQLRLTKIN
ncbi:MAG: hypothetical protein EBU01_15300 [Crocinitomicaceae bacterium]|nr:hypothetical protein [Crocinitomicaceae bacterium]